MAKTSRYRKSYIYTDSGNDFLSSPVRTLVVDEHILTHSLSESRTLCQCRVVTVNFSTYFINDHIIYYIRKILVPVWYLFCVYIKLYTDSDIIVRNGYILGKVT